MLKKVLYPGIVAGLAVLVIGILHSLLVSYAFPSLGQEYANTAIFRPFDDPLMILFYIHPFVLGLIIAWVWDMVKTHFKTDPWHRGFNFGAYFGVVTLIPGMLITYSSMQVSLTMIITWTAAGFLNAIVAGIILAKLNP